MRRTCEYVHSGCEEANISIYLFSYLVWNLNIFSFYLIQEDEVPIQSNPIGRNWDFCVVVALLF